MNNTLHPEVNSSYISFVWLQMNWNITHMLDGLLLWSFIVLLCPLVLDSQKYVAFYRYLFLVVFFRCTTGSQGEKLAAGTTGLPWHLKCWIDEQCIMYQSELRGLSRKHYFMWVHLQGHRVLLPASFCTVHQIFISGKCSRAHTYSTFQYFKVQQVLFIHTPLPHENSLWRVWQ